MLRKQVPDLDSLESPLISANPFGSILDMVPGSTLAERIFNDPHSWQGADDDDGDLEDAEAMRWLADELGKCLANGEELSLSPVDRDVDIIHKSLSEKATTASETPPKWDDITQKNKLSFLPRLDPSLDLNLNVDLRFSKIWDAQGKTFHSLQSPLSPANESKTFPSIAENVRLAAPTALDLGAADNTLSSITSPLTVASASTTWSILEWYGAHSNTPRVHGRVPLLTHYPPTPYHTKPPVLSSLHAPSSSSANATVSTPATPPISESTPVRRLPVIPDTHRITSSPTPSRAPTPSRGSTPEHTPQRTKSPKRPQYIKTPASSTATPNRSRPRRIPRGSATPPAPSGSPDPFNSPNVTLSRSGNLVTCSPPAGPRPRSGTNPLRQRQASGRDSPSLIVIEPAPACTRKPSPPLLHQGVLV